MKAEYLMENKTIYSLVPVSALFSNEIYYLKSGLKPNIVISQIQ